MKINNLNFDPHKLRRPVESGSDRFGFEVLPDGAARWDDDSLSGIKMIKAGLALVAISALCFGGFKLYEKLESLSFSAMLEKRIENPSAESETWALKPIVSEPITGPEPATSAKAAPDQQRKGLLNAGESMRASFPMPPDSPPEDYYEPGREVPAGRPKARALAGFDPDEEAFDPERD